MNVDAGGTSYAVDPVAIEAAGRVLLDSVARLGADRQYGPLTGLGESADLIAATRDFQARWDAELGRWQESLTSFSGAVTESGRLLAAGDAGQAAAWSRLRGDVP